MGRPKKVVDMNPEEVNGNVAEIPVEYSDMAVGMVSYGGKYIAVQIPFNFTTGEVGEVETVETNTDRDVILTRFEVLSGKIMGWNI